jgi:hypothetical protein
LGSECKKYYGMEWNAECGQYALTLKLCLPILG